MNAIKDVVVISQKDYEEYQQLKKGVVKDLVVGKWYKFSVYGTDSLFMYNGGKNCTGFWFGMYGTDWNFGDNGVLYDSAIEATEKEIKQALVKEAKRRGLVEGVRIKSRWLIRNTDGTSATPISNVYSYDPFSNRLSVVNSGHSYTLFKDGEWAEPITEVDKFADIKKAYDEGTEVEFYSKVYGEWRPKRSNIWDGNVEYRIRPLKAGDWIQYGNGVDAFEFIKISHGTIHEYNINARVKDQELIDKLNTLAENKD